MYYIIYIQDGKIFYSIDGNFGLCRKRASGSSVRPPLHERTKFCDQECVDQYVGNYGTIKMSANKVLLFSPIHNHVCLCKLKECNQFLAGDALRSKSRYKALDETGVIGMVCRHEFPHKLLSMRHGER